MDIHIKVRDALHEDTTIQSGDINLNLECDHDVLFYNLTQKLTTTKQSLYADLMKVIKQMNKLKQSFVDKKNEIVKNMSTKSLTRKEPRWKITLTKHIKNV